MTIPYSQLVTLAEQDATNAGISPVYFVRQINLESGFNPNAVSPGGAEGIAQFEPATAAGLGIDPFNPTEALQAAAQMMAAILPSTEATRKHLVPTTRDRPRSNLLKMLAALNGSVVCQRKPKTMSPPLWPPERCMAKAK